MKGVGNDNYRPGLEPPEPMSGAGSSWLSGNIAQLMVFLNGLILTVTAFATLTVFIQEMVTDSVQRNAGDVRDYIIERAQSIEATIDSISAFISLTGSVDDQSLIYALENSSINIESFDRLYWLQQSREGAWNGKSLLKDSQQLSFTQEQDNKIIKRILKRDIEDLEGTRFLFDVNEIDLVQVQENPAVFDRGFVVVSALEFDNGRRDFIIGFSHLYSAMDMDWLKKRESMISLTIVDVETQNTIYDYTNNEKDTKPEDTFDGEYNFSISDSNLTITLVSGIEKRDGFLLKIPLLLLLFGVTLTLIGTLYVRNNQRQALRLSSMNRELAQKNFELNNEVSERERLNQVIQKAERENRAIINAVSDIIFETGTDGEILFLNETWMRVTGFEVDQSLNRNLFDMLYLQDQEEQRQNFDDLVRGKKKGYRTFTRIRTSNGTFRSVELAVSMLRQDETKNLRVVGTITDVEERRRAERALSEAEKKYRQIVENAAGGIYQMTPEGQYLSANPAMARILGYETPEQLLREVRNANHDVYKDQIKRQSYLRGVESGGVQRSAELEGLTKNGDIIWLAENTRAVKDDQGNLLYFEGSIENITQRKVSDNNLREAKVQSDLANRAKSEFLANMSHELRTPLNAVIGFSEIIKNEAFGKVEQKEYVDYAKDIYDNGKQLLNVINEILDISRIEAGERSLNEGLVSPEKLVLSCLDLMESKIQANEMRVSNLVDSGAPDIIGEELAIKQMVMNLLSNAVKFTPSGGLLTVSHELDANGEMRLSITDTGVGLDEKEMEKALSPFGQVDTSLSRSGSGTGLGLTLVDSLVKLHGGHLELFSQKGIGTTATLIFPVKRVSSSGQGKPEDAAVNNDQPSVTT